MPWSLIISGLWVIFGPYITELARLLLDKWFKKAAKLLPEPSFGGVEEGSAEYAVRLRNCRLELIDKTLEILPWHAKGRKTMLRVMRAAIMMSGLSEIQLNQSWIDDLSDADAQIEKD